MPDIARVLQLAIQFEFQGLALYIPKRWVAWAGPENTCGFPIQAEAWPGALLAILELLGYQPREFIYQDGETNFYVIVRPPLLHELVEDFNGEGY